MMQMELASRPRPLERDREGMADRRGLIELVRRLAAAWHPTTSTPIRFCTCVRGTRTAGPVPSSDAQEMTFEMSGPDAVFRPGTAPGDVPDGPGIWRQLVPPGRRHGVQGVAGAVEVKQNRVSAVDGRNSVMMEHRKQIAQPVGRRQRLEQAGLA
jgi:hypothetical protein